MQDLHHRLGQLGRNLGVWSVALMVRSFEFFCSERKIEIRARRERHKHGQVKLSCIVTNILKPHYLFVSYVPVWSNPVSLHLYR